ncbi:MAG: hypothetical protein M1115_03270 [Actinobacteria bacterium]|nr:hypothetical protein [Actinomycetota bacterium]
MFWNGVAEDIVANLLAAAAFGSVTVGVAYWRFSGRLERLRHWIHPIRPDGRVIVAAEGDLSPTQPKKNDPTPFRSPISLHERDELVAFYERLNLITTSNGRVIRLDSLEPQVGVSVVNYFDLLATNLTAFSANTSLLSTAASVTAMWRWVKLRPVIDKVIIASRTTGRHPATAKEVLSNPYLANVAGVSILLLDKEHMALFTQHPRNPAAASDAWQPTATGTVGVADLANEDPFAATARRVLIEHVGLKPEAVEATTLSLEAVVLPKRKLQPYFCYIGMISGPWAECLPELGSGDTKSGMLDNGLKFRLIDAGNAKAMARFCRVAQESQTTSFLAWRCSSQLLGEDELAAAWRHRWTWAGFQHPSSSRTHLTT